MQAQMRYTTLERKGGTEFRGSRRRCCAEPVMPKKAGLK
jgi:hypothetical protein